MNLKTFIFMMLTFREIYQIPRNIQTYLSITMWEVIQKMLCPDGVVAVTCSLTAAVEIMRVAPAGWYRYDLVKILDTNIHESGRCGNGSGSRERNDMDSGLRGGKGLPAYGDRPSIL